MLFYTTSTFRETLAALTKKSKDGYMSVVNESKNNQLHQVDITNGLAELSQNECLPGDKRD